MSREGGGARRTGIEARRSCVAWRDRPSANINVEGPAMCGLISGCAEGRSQHTPTEGARLARRRTGHNGGGVVSLVKLDALGMDHDDGDDVVVLGHDEDGPGQIDGGVVQSTAR